MLKIEATYIRHDYRNFPEVKTTLEVEPEKLAFLIVDMQNDFAHPEGMMARKVADIGPARRTVEPTRLVAGECRRAGVKVIYTQHIFRADLTDMGKSWARIYRHRPGTISPGDKVGPAGQKSVGSLVKGTWNAEIIDELKPQAGDIVVDNKRTYSGFYHTDLDMILRNLGIETIMFAGLTTAVCVESTLRDAFFHGYECILLKDCAWEKTPELQAASEKLVMIHFGSVTTSEAVIRALGNRRQAPGNRQ